MLGNFTKQLCKIKGSGENKIFWVLKTVIEICDGIGDMQTY